MNFPYWEFSLGGIQVGLGEIYPTVNYLDSSKMMEECNNAPHKLQIITPMYSFITEV